MIQECVIVHNEHSYDGIFKYTLMVNLQIQQFFGICSVYQYYFYKSNTLKYFSHLWKWWRITSIMKWFIHFIIFFMI